MLLQLFSSSHFRNAFGFLFQTYFHAWLSPASLLRHGHLQWQVVYWIRSRPSDRRSPKDSHQARCQFDGNFSAAVSSLRIKTSVFGVELDRDIVKSCITKDGIHESLYPIKPWIHNPVLYLCEYAFHNNALISFLPKRAPGPSCLSALFNHYNYHPNSDLLCFPWPHPLFSSPPSSHCSIYILSAN